MTEGTTTFTVRERLDILETARNFFEEVGKLHNKSLLFKSAAIGTVIDGLKMLEEKGVNLNDEENLEEAMHLVIDEDFINKMIEDRKMEGEDEDFYRGGFGFCVGILQNDEETYDGFMELQEEWHEKILPMMQEMQK